MENINIVKLIFQNVNVTEMEQNLVIIKRVNVHANQELKVRFVIDANLTILISEIPMDVLNVIAGK